MCRAVLFPAVFAASVCPDLPLRVSNTQLLLLHVSLCRSYPPPSAFAVAMAPEHLPLWDHFRNIDLDKQDKVLQVRAIARF
jgi:hypothetical protein